MKEHGDYVINRADFWPPNETVLFLPKKNKHILSVLLLGDVREREREKKSFSILEQSIPNEIKMRGKRLQDSYL